jgi:hypothetical protein
MDIGQLTDVYRCKFQDICRAIAVGWLAKESP